MITTMDKISRKATATNFLQLASSGKVKEAYQLYIGVNFRYHNPYFQGDAATLLAAMEENAAANPHKTIEIYHAIEEGDLAAIHACVKLKPGDLGIATIHLFRFEGDRIVELWDVGQAVPEKTPNENGMF
jgi:predicted SnoaL-like aldol condensation-catalyzing enzyme